MARIRKAVSYRRLERPYTRTSKYRKKSFIRGAPHISIVRYDMGNLRKTFPTKVHLVSKSNIQIRHNAIESARQTMNRYLERNLGKEGYYVKIRPYPHHILRENPLASGAGADRMSTGMAASFGKSISRAARIKEGQIVFSVGVDKNKVTEAKEALRRAYTKLPCSFKIVVEA